MTLDGFLRLSEPVYSSHNLQSHHQCFRVEFSKYLFNVFVNEHPFLRFLSTIALLKFQNLYLVDEKWYISTLICTFIIIEWWWTLTNLLAIYILFSNICLLFQYLSILYWTIHIFLINFTKAICVFIKLVLFHIY